MPKAKKKTAKKSAAKRVPASKKKAPASKKKAPASKKKAPAKKAPAAKRFKESAPAPVVVAAPTPPSEAEIRERAALVWQQRGRPTGEDVAIWFEAERQLLAERS